MKKRCSFLALLLVLSMVLSACGSTQTETTPEATDQQSEKTYVINFGHGGAAETAQGVGGEALKEYIERESNGRITVNVYHAGQLGTDRELAEGTQDGTVQMCLTNANQVAFVPDTAVFDLFFEYKDIDSVIEKYRNDQNFRSVIEPKYEAAGYKLCGYSVHGFRNITANKPIYTPEDLKGMTFRTQANDYQIYAMECLDTVVTPTTFAELYTALQQGTVEAQETSDELMISQKLYEQQKYVTLTHNQEQVQTWIMNLDFYNSLPDDLKKVVDDGCTYACDAAQKFAFDMEDEWQQEIIDGGCTYIELTPEQLDAFKAAVAPQWEKVKNDVDPAVWDAYMAGLE